MSIASLTDKNPLEKPTKPQKIGLVSLGCAKNLVDSEKLMRQLEANHFKPVFDPSDIRQIDSAIINTCGFINDAKKESIDTILQFAQAKKNNQIRHLYVMGCLSERYKDQLIKELPEVDAFYGVNDLEKIIHQLGGQWFQTLKNERKLATPPHYAYLKISEGCDRKCAFCAIPRIRGKHVSRPFQEIIKEAGMLANAGVKEINIIAQDTTYYGLDLYKKRRLPELLSTIAQIKGFEWIRLHYAFPDGFPVELLQVVNTYPNICKYIDIPLQHINDRVLKAMRRGADAAKTRDIIQTIRKTIPDVAIRTTFIVGFPGETEQAFRELMQFVEESQFDRMGVFTYSREEGTSAYRLGNPVSETTKSERAGALMDLQEGISRKLNEKKVNSIQKVIVDRKEGEYYLARTSADSPDVDNEVLISQNGRRIKTGSFYNVRIAHADSFDLYAEIP